MKQAMKTHLGELEELVATLRIQVHQPDVIISVNGDQKSLSGDGILTLDPGTVELRAEKAGFRTETRTVTLTAGTTRNERFQLASEQAPAAPAVVFPPPSEVIASREIAPADAAHLNKQDAAASHAGKPSALGFGIATGSSPPPRRRSSWSSTAKKAHRSSPGCISPQTASVSPSSSQPSTSVVLVLMRRCAHAFSLCSTLMPIVLSGALACRGAVEPDKDERALPPLTEERARQLESIGYVTAKKIDATDARKDGVTVNTPGRASPGVNVYCSENASVLKFADMNGRVIHSVTVNADDAKYKSNQCKTAGFDRDGNAVVLITGTALVKTDLAGKELWRLNGNYHHDVDVMPDGTVFALAQSGTQRFSEFTDKQNIIDNQIVRISPDGRVTQSISIATMVQQVPPLLRKARAHFEQPRYASREVPPDYHKADVIHTNTIEVLRRDLRHEGNLLFNKGYLLICARHLDAAMVVDPKKQSIVWHFGTEALDYPHHPTQLGDGSVLLFDNGVGMKRSRVLQVDAASKKILRTYMGTPPPAFFSRTRGSVQQLENGNWLICESERGHVFEVDADDTIVWEFWNPDRNRENDERITIFEFARLTEKEHPFISKLR